MAMFFVQLFIIFPELSLHDFIGEGLALIWVITTACQKYINGIND